MGNWLFPSTSVPRARGRGRAGRGRGQQRGSGRQLPRGRGRGRGRGTVPRSQGMQPARGIGVGRAGDKAINTEALPVAKATFKVIEFTPGRTGLPILDSLGERFTRYRVNYVNIAYLATDATTASSVITWGIAPGQKLTEIDKEADILALRPFKKHATWKSENLSVGRAIMPSQYLYCGDTSRDGVAFCLYYYSGSDTGVFKISYSIQFDYPNPLPASSLALSLSQLVLDSEQSK